ncbi:MAG TPA: ABC transporter permease [Bryobacteraceae bacterium]|jgi:predicted permease
MRPGELWRKLHYLVNRRRIERELGEELDAHRAEMGEHAAGFGSSLKLREDSNEAWGFGWLDRLRQDIHYGMRVMRKSPAFTLTAIAILALGIGLNVTFFGFIDVIALRPLPVKDPDSIVLLWRASPSSQADNFSYSAFDFYRQHNRVFSSMWALCGGDLKLESGENIKVRFVTPEFFGEMGHAPELGQFLSSTSSAGSVVVSHRFWQRHLGGDPAVLHRTVRMNHYAAVIAGVAASDFVSVNPGDVDVWIPMTDQTLYIPGSKMLTDRSMTPLHVFARLLPGLSRQAAENGLKPIIDEYRKQAPDDVWKDEYSPLKPGSYVELLDSRILGLLMIPAALLILVLAAACANLGNLLLARGATREREISIRTAAGASRGRIIRQLLTESVMLALAGAAASVPLSMAAIRMFVLLSDAPAVLDFTPDWRIGLFAFTVALIAAILFGLAPALQTSRPTAKRAGRMRLTLVTAQVATSCILVILSGLMTRALVRGLTTPPGFAFKQSASIYLDLGSAGMRGTAAHLFLDRFRARISEVPGVESVALSVLPPLGNAYVYMGHPVGKIAVNSVDANYFATMQIPLYRGRTFRSDDPDSNIIISDRLARRLWPNEDPIGKKFLRPTEPNNSWTVIGVAGNAAILEISDSDALELYHPITGAAFENATVIVRTSNLDAAVGALDKAAQSVDKSVPARVVPIRDGYESRMGTGRMAAMSISALGGVALLVAIVGLTGLISYAVTQRTKEIGIRMALGARPSEALRVGFAQLVKPVAIGLLIGIGAAAGLAQTLRFTLFGLSPVDPISYVTALLLFGSLVAMAAIPPLRRAARVDPATALRHD